MNDHADQTTIQNIALWVDAARGSDWNSGVEGAPLKTIGAALRKIPLVVRHAVTINVRAGIYQAVLDLMFLFPDASSIEVVGQDWEIFTPITGIQSGTFDANFGTQAIPNTATCAGGGWTVDDLKGKFIRVTTGTNSDRYLPIATNTATTMDLGMPADRITGGGLDLQGQAFSIVEHAVILEQQGAFDHLIEVSGINGPSFGPGAFPPALADGGGVHFRNFQFNAGSTYTALRTGACGNLKIYSCKLSFSNMTTYGFWASRPGGWFNATDCYWAMQAAKNEGVWGVRKAMSIGLNFCIMDHGGIAGSIASGGTLVISGIYQNQGFDGFWVADSSVICQSSSMVFRGQQRDGIVIQGGSSVWLQPADGCGFIMNVGRSGIAFKEAPTTSASHNSLQLNNLTIENCVTGVQIERGYNYLDLQNSTIRNNSAWGVNMAADKHAGFNSVATNGLTAMNGNANGDFTMDGLTPTSLAALRADPDKDMLEPVRFNRLFEV